MLCSMVEFSYLKQNCSPPVLVNSLPVLNKLNSHEWEAVKFDEELPTGGLIWVINKWRGTELDVNSINYIGKTKTNQKKNQTENLAVSFLFVSDNWEGFFYLFSLLGKGQNVTFG